MDVIIPILAFSVEGMRAGGVELGSLVASYTVMCLTYGPIWADTLTV